jgi:CRP-like cAMP-binding protein
VSPGTPRASDNLLLAAMRPEHRHRLEDAFERVELVAGDVVQDGVSRPAALLFPLGGLVSLNCPLSDGSALAVALVGRDGAVGLSLLLDPTLPGHLAIVQAPGTALRLPVRAARREVEPGGALAGLAWPAVQALQVQVAQTAACNRHHTLDQQICRWLLLSLDRQAGSALSMTHEQIAQLLGVRREGVTAAAGKLQDTGAIEYARGRINVLDRAFVETRACECYGVVRDECRRLAPGPAAPVRAFALG